MTARQRTLMVMAGGTGGHVFPALAVADRLHHEGWKIVWLGTRAGLEARVVPERGYQVIWLRMAGVRGSGIVRKLLLPVALLASFGQSLGGIFRHRPDVVLGMGGYTAFPGGMMASLMARPLVIHEQNSIGGLTNRILACLADRVLVAFPQAFQGERDKPVPCGKALTEWCGNPVRTDIASLPPPAARFEGRTGRLRLLVVGGSLGAAALNEVVPEALSRLPAAARPEVVHQAGGKHLETLRANYARHGVEADVRGFIDNMAEVYGWCDLVLCRAGALTVSELAAAGVASVLVPYPYAVDDHQTENARFLSEKGAALLMPQTELTADRLAAILADSEREGLLRMGEAARRAAKIDATEVVARICKELAHAA